MKKVLMASTLLLAMLRGAFAIEPAAAEAYKPLVFALLNGQSSNLQELMPQRSASRHILQSASSTSIVAYHQRAGFAQAPKNSVALLELHDVVMKYDFCGSYGTRSLMQQIQEADANPNIKGILLSIDSPGGSVNGTLDFTTAIKAAKKPVVTFSHGMRASAAYEIGSAAKHVMLSNDGVMVGSIGTMITLQDWRGWMEKEGIKEHVIYATASTHKNATYQQAIDGNYDSIKSELLDPINNQFLATVRKNRYGKGLKKEALTGKVFLGKQAIEMGLADSIGTMDDAIALIEKLSTQKAA